VAVLQGYACAEILDAATARGANLIVMSTHGRSGIGRWLYGSVAAVLRSARVPVMLISSDVSVAWATDRPLRILVPLDGLQLSKAVLGPAVDLASRLEAELLLVEVVAWPPIVYSDPIELLPYDPEEEFAQARGYLADMAARLRGSGAGVRCHAGVGQTPAETIVRLARDEHADLIAMATHGRGGLARVVLGSTTTGTLQHARVPLLIVRPTELQAAESPVPERATSPIQA
jgi:nucleotide-binding universal stress UspA family protein